MARLVRLGMATIMGLIAVHAMTIGANLVYPGLTIRVPDDCEAEPGELVSYGFVITNTGAKSLHLYPSIAADPDWPIFGETGPIPLNPKEEAVVAVSVFVPAEAPAGTEHHLRLTLSGGDNPITVGVVTRVKERHGLDLAGPPAVTAPAGAGLVLPFLLTNSGNVEELFRLQAVSAGGWEVSLPFASVLLPPGEARSIDCAVKIPDWAPPGLTEEVTLIAVSAAGCQAQAKARIKVGQPAGGGRIPVGEEEFRLTGDLGFSFAAPSATAEPPRLWLHAVGSDSPGERLEILLTGEGGEDRPVLGDYFILYRENGYEVKAGNFPSTWPGQVFPGSFRMGLEASSALESGRLRIMGGLDDEEGNPSWYALDWSAYRRGWSGSLRLLSTRTGINGSDAPYLDLSLDRYLLGASFSGDLAVELKEGGRSAGYLQYSVPAAPFGWEGGFSWANGINRPNSVRTFSLGGTYNPASGFKAGLSLSQTEATATPTESAYLARQGDLRLRLGARTTAVLTAKGVWEENFAWNLSQTYYLFKLSYQDRLPGSLLEVGTVVSSTEDMANGSPPQYGLSLNGRYRFASRNSTGTWEMRLEGGIVKNDSGRDWNLNLADLKIGYEDKFLLSQAEGSYRLGLAYTTAPASLKGFTAEAALAFHLGSDTRLNAALTASPAEFTLSLETVHRFGLGIPRPHATINGLVFQDLNGDGEPGTDEPGLAGLRIVLDGKPVGRSGPDGRWSLLGVKPGIHTVSLEAEDPALRPQSGPATVELRAGGTEEIFFPVLRLTTLTGCLFLDRDGDGLPGEEDEVLPGFSLVLARPDGGTETAATAKDGTFLFADLPPGDYTLRVKVPADFAEGIEPPGPFPVRIEQQGNLPRNLALEPKEKPLVVTYMEAPQVLVNLTPETVEPGGVFALAVACEVPMTRIRLTLPGMPPEETEVSGTQWQGTLAVPPDRPPGPMEIEILVWWSGGREPVPLKARVEVREPLRLTAAAAPDRVPPGGKVLLTLAANRPLAAARLFLPWGGTLSLACRGEKAVEGLTLPAELLTGGPLSFRFAARDEEGVEKEAEARIVLDPLPALALLRLYPFDVGSAAVKREFRPVLARLAAVLRANPGLRLLIVGYADATGKKETNEALSLKRAAAVKQVLVEDYGLDPARLRTVGKGSAAPIGDNATPEGRALNRRVEFAAAEGEN